MAAAVLFASIGVACSGGATKTATPNTLQSIDARVKELQKSLAAISVNQSAQTANEKELLAELRSIELLLAAIDKRLFALESKVK